MTKAYHSNARDCTSEQCVRKHDKSIQGGVVAMEQIQFTLKGTRPLMVNAENPFEDVPAKPGRKVRDPKPRDEAARHLHMAKMNGGGLVPVLPGINVQKCVQSTYSYMPGRKGGWVKATRTISIMDQHLPISPVQWTLDARRATAAGGRGSGKMLFRPRFDEWSLRGTVQFDPEFVSEEELRQMFDFAGRYQGLGSWRIGVGGPYGAFMVTGWEKK